MEIPLDLSKHCIQTEIKKLYSRSIGTCFRESVNPEEMEDRIEMLREALEGFDFAGLRTKHRELCGGDSTSRICLIKDPDGRILISINGNAVNP